MKIDVLTIFPAIVEAYLGESLMGKARERGLADIRVHDIRAFAGNKHNSVDDYPYGGGPGMVMTPEPIERALESIRDGNTLCILMSPQGRRFTQEDARRLSTEPRRLVFLCGRYEGIDERVVEEFVDEEFSIGDYVLTGGELPALVIIDAALRMVPGVVGDAGSLEEESFAWGMLDYPHYTRPPLWRGRPVPEVLMSGNHALVRRYRRKEALRRTMLRRPDLLKGLSPEDEKLILEIKEEVEDGTHQGG